MLRFQLSHFHREALIGQVGYISLNFSFLVSEMGTVMTTLVGGCENHIILSHGNNNSWKHDMEMIVYASSKQWQHRAKTSSRDTLDFLQNKRDTSPNH